MFNKTKRYNKHFMHKPEFTSYEINYSIEIKEDAFSSFLANKIGLKAKDEVWNLIKQHRANGLKPSEESDVFSYHSWKEYVDLRSGLILYWDRTLKCLVENPQHESYLLYNEGLHHSNKTDSLEHKYLYSRWNFGIDGVNVRESILSNPETLFNFKPFRFTQELFRLEASQSGMHKYLFKDIPPAWLNMFEEWGVKYTSHYYNNDLYKDMKHHEFDFDYEFKNEGLTFYDQITDQHQFENDLFKYYYSIRFNEPFVHFGHDFR